MNAHLSCQLGVGQFELYVKRGETTVCNSRLLSEGYCASLFPGTSSTEIQMTLCWSARTYDTSQKGFGCNYPSQANWIAKQEMTSTQIPSVKEFMPFHF